MKKVLSLILALLMTTSAASYVFADDAIAGDAAADTPAATAAVAEEAEKAPMTYEERAAAFLSEYNIMVGYSEEVKELGLEDDIQRYQMALFVGRISTGWTDDDKWEDGPQNWSGFSDLDGTAAANYLGALSYASSKGIIEGYGDGRFGPEDGIAYQDGLTMIVRTLGYTGLNWPWGYIQKAVDLGITEGIEGVAYSDTLTRGQVAILLYNALFTKTSTGEKLAVKCFGAELGWEPIVITASNLDIYNQDNEEAVDYLKGGYTYYDKSQKIPYGSEGLVAFKILAEDGTLGDDTYYVESAELGIKSADHSHEDEMAVGDVYYVLFKENADNKKLVTIVPDCYFKMAVTDNAYDYDHDGMIENEGKTDDTGASQEYPIQNFLADYALVEKYSGKNYVNTTTSLKQEILAYAAHGVYNDRVYHDGSWIAIDWQTGDLLEPVDSDGDGEYDSYRIAWFYSSIYNNYWRLVNTYSGTKVEVNNSKLGDDIKYDSNGWSDLDYYAVDWMSEKELQDFKDKWGIDKHAYSEGYKAQTSIPVSAYASLRIYDSNPDDDQAVDRATYESYRIGYFYNSNCNTIWNHSGHKTNLYMISSLAGNLTDSLVSAEKANAEAKFSALEASTSVEVVVEGQDVDCKKDDKVGSKVRGWMVPGYTPVEDGNGGYLNGYVIYNYDKETGAIKVVKNITSPATTTDKDSFVTTGVVQAYNVAKGTVVIDGVTYNFKDYNELEGSMFAMLTASKNDAQQKAVEAFYSAYFKTLFNQFVEYVVVDNSLVGIKRQGATTQDFIIVQSYAGMSDDGYIVVNGFLASELKYRQFKIASYNNWMKGSYSYYMSDAQAAQAFTQGAVYAISSRDIAENGRDTIYYVQLAGEYDFRNYTTYSKRTGNWTGWTNAENYNDPITYEIDTEYIASADIVITTTGDGYATYKVGSNAAEERKMLSSDQYIFLYEKYDSDYRYAPYDFFTGTLSGTKYCDTVTTSGEGDKIVGKLIGNTAWNSGRYIIVVSDDSHFSTQTLHKRWMNEHNGQLVVLLGNNYSSASFDRLVNDTDNWYLLGASTYTLNVMDLLTGEFIDVIGVNMAPKKNHVYYCIDGYIIEDVGELDARVSSADNYYYFIEALNYMYNRNYKDGDSADGETSINEKWNDVAGYFVINDYLKSNGKYFESSFIGGDKITDTTRTHLEALLNAQKFNLSYTHGGRSIAGLKVYAVTFGANGKTIDDMTAIESDAQINKRLEAYADDHTNTAISKIGAAFARKGTDYVVYLFINEAADVNTNTTTGSIYDEDKYDYSPAEVVVPDVGGTGLDTVEVTPAPGTTTKTDSLVDAAIKAEFIYRPTTEDGVVKSYDIYGIRYYFDIAKESYLKADHAQIQNWGYNFGLTDDHKYEGYKVEISIGLNSSNEMTSYKGAKLPSNANGYKAETEVVWGSIAADTYNHTTEGCPGCNMISTIDIMFDEPVKLETWGDSNQYFNSVQFTVSITRDGKTNPAFWNGLKTAYVSDGDAQDGLGMTGCGTSTKFHAKAFNDASKDVRNLTGNIELD